MVSDIEINRARREQRSAIAVQRDESIIFSVLPINWDI